MNKQIIYSLVARGSLILTEYTENEGDFPVMAKKILPRVKKNEEKQIFTKDNYMFCVYCHQEYKFLCMVESEFSKETAFIFLENIKNDYFEQQSKDPSFNSAKYAQRLSQFMKHNQPYNPVDVLEKNIDTLNEQAQQNLNKMIERDVKLDVLVQKTNDLSENSDLLYNQSRRLKNNLNKQRKTPVLQCIIPIIIIVLISAFSLYKIYQTYQ